MNAENLNQVKQDTIQNIVLENRGKLAITGVNDVLSFDDQIVIVDTELGMLTVKGEDLRINKLSLDTTEVAIDGTINSLNYSEKQSKGSAGFLSNDHTNSEYEFIHGKESIVLNENSCVERNPLL